MQISITNGALTQVQETLSPAQGYSLPQTVTVTGAASSYNNTTGALSLTNLTSTVAISAAAESSVTPSITFGDRSLSKVYFGNREVTSISLGNVVLYEVTPVVSYTITTSVVDGTYSGDSTITAGITALVQITPDSGCSLPSSVTVTGASYTYNQLTGMVSLTDPTGNVTLSVVCVNSKDDIAQFVEVGRPVGAYENDLVLSVGAYAFADADSMTSVSLPNAVSIGDYAFNYADELVTVSLPKAQSFGDQALIGCPKLETLYLGTQSQVVCAAQGSGLVSTDSLQAIYVPAALESAYKEATGWSTYASYIVGV